MGEHYRQLSLEERCAISRLHEDGKSIRQIAAALDRPASTVARELKRNSGNKVGYKPAYADQQAKARRWSGMRLERDEELREDVLARLRTGCSPEEVSGRLRLEQGRAVISYEHLPLHLRPAQAHQRLWLASLPAPRQVKARTARQTRRIPRQLHQDANSDNPTPRQCRRSPDARSLGSRLHALRTTRPQHPRGS